MKWTFLSFAVSVPATFVLFVVMFPGWWTFLSTVVVCGLLAGIGLWRDVAALHGDGTP